MQNPPHILIIDDDPVIRLLISETLQSAGFQTTGAANGEEGLELFRLHGADAILLDLMLPKGIDGFNICATLRELPESQHVPVLMMTGLEDMDSINQAFKAGATDFITKPINTTLLGYRVRYMLRASQATKRLLESERRLHRLAYFDNLTELPNRQFFRERLEIMIALAHRKKLKMAVLFLDLDGFKRINDSLGHHLGDLILQAAGERLQHTLRASDILTRPILPEEEISLARLGGDEFTVLLSSIKRPEDAANVAERIRISLAEPYSLDSQELYITTSIGIAIFPDNGDSAEELLKNADMAMYYSKRANGNTYRYFSSKMTEVATRRLTLDNNLRKAIERGQLSLHYQPQLDLKTGHFYGVETLLRWEHPMLGQISPTEFIPLAEGNGLIISIGEWVLRNACFHAKHWRNQGITIRRLAVNVSTLQILQRDFISLVTGILVEAGLEPQVLELELTESDLITDEENILAKLHSLKQLGIRLAIHDFGTEYSSLSRLSDFPIDCLKVDRIFVRDIETNTAKAVIVGAVISIAEGMGFKVIAEGVETEGQLEFLKNKQCDEVQGYLTSEPLPPEEIEKFFLRHQRSQ